MEISIAVAFLAGLVSFASPCTLPLVPAYVGYLVGSTPPDSPRMRSVAFRQGLFFVLGFTIVFVGLWASVGLVGYLFKDHVTLLRQVGGVVLIVMGLHVAKIIDLPFLARQVLVPSNRLFGIDAAGKRTVLEPSYARSVLFGVVFAAGWTPCVGPILGGVIGLASLRDTVGQGAILLLAYAAGHAVPFLLVALGAGAVMARLTWFRRHERSISLLTGAMLIAVGFLMITGLLIKLSTFVPAIAL